MDSGPVWPLLADAQYLHVGVPKAVNAWCLLSTPNSLPASRRIKKRHEFIRIQRLGQRSKSPGVVLISRTVREDGHVGFTVPKNVGKANIRNLVKRRLRHILRERSFMFEKRDLVVLALPPAANASFQQLQKDVERAYEGLRSRHRP